MLSNTILFLVAVCYFHSIRSASLPQSYILNLTCKATPLSPSWPSRVVWDAFNESISGQLLAPTPPAAVCDPSLSAFNEAACGHVASLWNNSDFHAKDPISIDQPNWENDACLPSLGTRCHLQQFPRYVVNVTEPIHVKKAVDIARERSIRLIVKGTGHDYLGRSTAPDSISIWTHNLRGLHYQDMFVPTGCSSEPFPAISVAAGHRMGEIYAATAEHGSIVIGGDDPDVGIGGYITGGGHSPLSGQYGLAADNVLELEVVTPAGDIVTLNECSHSDLFFAFRGGGGSTFGVILSATLRTFPIQSLSWSHFEFMQTKADNDTFWEATAYFHSQLPHLVQNGMMGYYNMTPVVSESSNTALLVSGAFIILNSSVAALDAVLKPVLGQLSTAFPVKVTSSTQYAPNFYEWWKTYYPVGPVATIDSMLGNRLLDEKALSSPTLADDLRTAYPTVGLLFNLVSGPGVWNAKPSGGLGSMTPAWRKAVVEMIVPVVWQPLDFTSKTQQTRLLTDSYMASLRRLAPDTGTYLNEADPNEPNRAQAYWGANYPRLLDLKRRYDPKGVFWCAPCVGAEDWQLTNGRLCPSE